MKIELLHDSDHPGAEGMPGDIIECDDCIAQAFIDGRGARIVVEHLGDDVEVIPDEPESEPEPVKSPITKPATAESITQPKKRSRKPAIGGKR